MIEQLTYIETDNAHPYKNLTVEEYLLLHCREKDCVIFRGKNRKGRYVRWDLKVISRLHRKQK